MTKALDSAMTASKNPPAGNVVRSKEPRSFVAGKTAKSSAVGANENIPNLPVTSFIH